MTDTRSLFLLRVCEFIYERVLPRLPRRMPRLEAQLVTLGVRLQGRLAARG